MKMKVTIPKILYALVFIFAVLAFSRSLIPPRNGIQKVYDDFITQLKQQTSYSLSSTGTYQPNSNSEIYPPVQIEFTIKEGGKVHMLRHNLDWNKSSDLKTSMRILDLIGIANVFSNTAKYNGSDSELSVKIEGASGAKFEGLSKLSEVQKNPSLAMALVLMRELSQ